MFGGAVKRRTIIAKWYTESMAKTTGNLDNTFWGLQRQSAARVINATAGQVIGLQRRRAPRRVRDRLRAQTGFPAASVFWRSLSDTQKGDWSAVGATYGLTGWQVFLQRGVEQWRRGPTELGAYSYGDAFYGLGSDVENLAANEIYSYKGGKIELFSASGVVNFTQAHPQDYTIRRRIPESKQVFENVDVNEVLVLPLTIGISYNIITDTEGDTPSAEFIAKIEYETESGPAFDEQGFTLERDSGWQRDTLIITETLGPIIGYSLQLRLSDFSGTVIFDNVQASHTATNWAIDPACNDVAPVYLTQWGNINPTWTTDADESTAVLSTTLIDQLTIE